jgi:hypothetical protein
MANFWVLITDSLAFFFYGLRCRQRLYYGLFEVAVALVIIFLTFHPGTVFLITDAKADTLGGGAAEERRVLLAEALGRRISPWAMVQLVIALTLATAPLTRRNT